MKNFSSKSIDIICLLLFLAFLCMPNKLFAIEHPELYADYQIDSSLTISVTDSGYWINFSLEPDSIRVLTLTNNVAIISSNNGDFYASEKFVIGL